MKFSLTALSTLRSRCLAAVTYKRKIALADTYQTSLEEEVGPVDSQESQEATLLALVTKALKPASVEVPAVIVEAAPVEEALEAPVEEPFDRPFDLYPQLSPLSPEPEVFEEVPLPEPEPSFSIEAPVLDEAPTEETPETEEPSDPTFEEAPIEEVHSKDDPATKKAKRSHKRR